MKKQMAILGCALIAMGAMAAYEDNAPQGAIIKPEQGAYFDLELAGMGSRTYEIVLFNHSAKGCVLGSWVHNVRRCVPFEFDSSCWFNACWGLWDYSYKFKFNIGNRSRTLKAETCGTKNASGTFLGRYNIYDNGTLLGTRDYSGDDMTTFSAESLYLFACHNATNAASASWFPENFAKNVWFARLTVWEGTATEGNLAATPLRNYVAAQDANGVACLYETVEKKYYYNKDETKSVTFYPDVGTAREAMDAENAAVWVEGVKARQRYPWNGLVDIDYQLCSTVPGAHAFVNFTASYTDAQNKVHNVAMKTFTGGLVAPVQQATGTYRATWNAFADIPQKVIENLKCTVSVNFAKYRVLDLETGETTFLDDVPAGGWTDEHKTTKMVFRLVQPQRYRKGWNVSLRDTNQEKSPGYYAITKPYYLAIFELTQGQAKIINGGTYYGNGFLGANRDKRPVSNISHVNLRGARPTIDWPNTGSAVAADSFIGKMRAKYGSDFYDLPTEAEWECAARCGTDCFYAPGDPYGTADRGYSPAREDRHGTNVLANAFLDTCGRYYYNGGYVDNGDKTWTAPAQSSEANGTAVVGSYLPNTWGFYDMAGNVAELVLDRWSGSWSVRDPGCYEDCPGASNDNNQRVVRGGSWDDVTTRANVVYVATYWSDENNNLSTGVRLCWRFPAE